MVRQFFRLVLFVLIRIWYFVRQHPGGTLGFLIGGFCGLILSVWMIRYGFPRWILPVQTLMWAVAAAPIVKRFLDGLK